MPEYSDLDQVVERAKTAKIDLIINASFDLDSSRQALELTKRFPNYMYAAVGIHPHDAKLATETAIAEIKETASDKNVVAIGETGLDYFHNKQPKDIQQAAFRKFLNLSQELDLPVVIHARDAQEDTINIMKEEKKGNLRGVFHCFAGDQKLIDYAHTIGFYISFAGMVTFKKADNVRENVKKIPLSMLLLETDCPYLAPEPYRGKRNEPAYIPIIAERIAKVKGVSSDEVAKITTQNAKKLFKI